MRCCHSLEDLPQQLYDSGYSASEVLTLTPGDVLDRLNITAPVSTSSIWDGLRWPTSSANVSLIGSPSLLGWEQELNATRSRHQSIDCMCVER